MHEIKVDKQLCPICKSKSTETKAVFTGKQYKLRTTCHNMYCITNKLN